MTARAEKALLRNMSQTGLADQWGYHKFYLWFCNIQCVFKTLGNSKLKACNYQIHRGSQALWKSQQSGEQYSVQILVNNFLKWIEKS